MVAVYVVVVALGIVETDLDIDVPGFFILVANHEPPVVYAMQQQ